MNLVIDKGNSRTKTAVFSGKEIVEIFHFDELSISVLGEVISRYKDLNRVILSSVSFVEPSIIAFLKTTFANFIELNSKTPVPIRNSYKTPETLGLDRLATAIGAMTIFPGQDILVIDAGTAITFDLIEKKGTFLGGNISPGMKSRFRALHEFTLKLPLIEESDQWPAIGRTTEDAIRAGVITGMLLEIDGMIDLRKKDYPQILIVLTGGDAQFFERRLKNHIFVQSEITLIGLNRILEYNVEKQ